jgi:CheY-like chemotaxis protein
MIPINILLIEDNEGDILLTKEALLEGDILKELQVVKDGWEALLYLEKKEKYKSSITPDLILLDIN